MSNATTGAISGAASGAAIGTAVLPGYGTAIGAGIGFIGGLFMGSEADAEAEALERERVNQLRVSRDLEAAQREQAEQLATAALTSGTSNVGQKEYKSPTGLLGDIAAPSQTGQSSKQQTASGTF